MSEGALNTVVGAILIAILLVVARLLMRRPIEADAQRSAVPCDACGYDLRHATDRCSECGVVVGEHLKYRSALLDGQIDRDPPADAELSTREVAEEEPIVHLLTVRSGTTARRLERRLLAAGVPAIVDLRLEVDPFGLRRGSTLGISVPQQDVPMARQVLRPLPGEPTIEEMQQLDLAAEAEAAEAPDTVAEDDAAIEDARPPAR